MAVGMEELPHRSAATVLLVPVQRGPLVGLAALRVTGPGRLLLGGGRRSSVTSCEHEGHRSLIFSPAPLLSYSHLGKGGEKSF